MREKKRKRKIVVAISGPPGIGSTSVSREVAKRLGLAIFVPGYLHKNLVKSKTKKESEAALLAWKTKKGLSSRTHKNRDELQVERAKRGNVVICGKLSLHFLKDLSDYKIWLYAPLRVRAKRVAERDGVSLKEAMKEISKRENIERKEWKRIYGFDYFYQEKIADLVIDSSNMMLEQTVDKIMKFIKSKKPAKKSRRD